MSQKNEALESWVKKTALDFKSKFPPTCSVVVGATTLEGNHTVAMFTKLLHGMGLANSIAHTIAKNSYDQLEKIEK